MKNLLKLLGQGAIIIMVMLSSSLLCAQKITVNVGGIAGIGAEPDKPSEPEPGSSDEGMVRVPIGGRSWGRCIDGSCSERAINPQDLKLVEPPNLLDPQIRKDELLKNIPGNLPDNIKKALQPLDFQSGPFEGLGNELISARNEFGQYKTAFDLRVNTYTGNLFYERTDLERIRLFNLYFTFFYNSGRTANETGYGQGWTHNFNLFYHQNGDTIFMELGDGRKDAFVWNGTGYAAPPGVFDSLSEYNTGQFLLVTKHGIRFFYDNNIHRHITSILDRNNNEISFSYNYTSPADVKLSTILYPGGQYNLAWNNGKCISLSDPNAIPPAGYTYQYDVFDNLSSVIDPMGNAVHYEYGYWSNLKKITDRNGNILDIKFNQGKAVAQVRCPGEDMVRSFTYDMLNQVTNVTDSMLAGDRVTGFEFDSLGRCITINLPDGSEENYTYNSDWNVTSFADQNGNPWLLNFDNQGNLLGVTEPDGSSSSYSYDPTYNLLTGETDPSGNTTIYQYDVSGNLVMITDALGNAAQLAYDNFGRFTAYINKNGYSTTYNYDNFHNLITETDAYGNSLVFGYDPMGKVTSVTDKMGNITLFDYDVLERLVRITNALGGTEEYSYDANGNVTSSKNERNFVTGYTYDGMNRMLSLTDPLTHNASFHYNEAGEIIQYADFTGDIHHFEYNIMGRLTEAEDPLGNTAFYSYDNNGNITRYTDKRGNPTIFHYTSSNLCDTISNAMGVKAYLKYDLNGNPDTVVDFNGNTYAYSYNAIDLLVTHKDPLLNTVTMTYDDESNLVSYTDENSNTTNYLYDHMNRLIQVTSPDLSSENYAYDASGNIISYDDKNDHHTSFIFDELNRRITVKHPYGISEDYLFDAGGNRTSFTDGRGNITLFEFDALDRLIKRTDPAGYYRTFSYDQDGNRVMVTNETNHTSNYQYDPLNRQIGVSDPLNHSDSTVYDEEGNIIAYYDKNGNKTIFGYDALNRQISTTDEFLNQKSFSYDPNGNLLSLTDKNGHLYQYRYDALNRNDTLIDPLLNQEILNFDANGKLLSYKDKKNFTTQFLYDCCRLIRITDAMGFTENYFYDDAGNVTTYRNKKNIPTHVLRDSLDRIIQVTDSLGYYMAFIYDNSNNRISAQDKNGNITLFHYGVTDRLDSVTDPLLFREKYFYDGSGNKLGYIDKGGDTTHYDYDDAGRMIAVTDPLGYLKAFSYDNEGKRTAVQDENGYITTFIYDQLSRLQAITDPYNKQIQYSYDPEGNKTGMTDKSNLTTFFTYDALDRMVKTVNAAGDSAIYAYDEAGNPVSEADWNGYTTHYVYDSLNRLIMAKAPYNNLTSFQYDRNNNLLAFTDPNSHTRSFSYDVLDRVVTMLSPLNHLTQYQYDAIGDVTVRIDPDGQAITYGYDAMHRNVQTMYPDNTSVSRTYDSKGNLSQISGTGGLGDTVQFSYDAAKQVVARTISYGNLFSKTSYYEYDPAGNRISEDQGPDHFEYQYDSLNRLVKQKNPDNDSTEYFYDFNGKRVEMTHSNQVYATYEYGNAGHLTGLTYRQSNGDTIVSYSYVNDAVGNRQVIQEKYPADFRQVQYSYDSLYRLVGVVSSWAPQEIYAYDPAGNRVFMSAGGPPVNYIYDPENKLVFDGKYSYTYDQKGNLVLKNKVNPPFPPDSHQYNYDFENQMTKYIHTNTDTVQYQYGADGRRLSRTASPASYYGYKCYYDREVCKWFCQLQYEYDLSGNTQVTYTNGPRLDEPISLSTGGTKQYYQNDGLNSVRAMLDISQNIVASYDYDAFGNISSSNGASVNPFRFGARPYEQVSGLYFNESRFYDPSAGRFISQDPLVSSLSAGCSSCGSRESYKNPVSGQTGARSSQPMQQYLNVSEGTMNNLYAYVGNNPVNYIDPLGLSSLSVNSGYSAAGAAYLQAGTNSGCGAGCGNPLSYLNPGLYGEYERKTGSDKEGSDPGHNGITACDITKKACEKLDIHNVNYTCTKECTQEHEEQHNADRKECCDQARKAFDKVKQDVINLYKVKRRLKGTELEKAIAKIDKDKDVVAARDQIVDKFTAYTNNSHAWSECRAYTKSVECADRLWKDKDCECPTEENKKCCEDIRKYKEGAGIKKKVLCQLPGAGIAPNCPNFNVIKK